VEELDLKATLEQSTGTILARLTTASRVSALSLSSLPLHLVVLNLSVLLLLKLKILASLFRKRPSRYSGVLHSSM
jgi:hypothetical protein